MLQDLQNIKEQLFDAPAEIKSAFNDVVEYFSKDTEERIKKILNKPFIPDDPETKYIKFLKSGTRKELMDWIKFLDKYDFTELLTNDGTRDLDYYKDTFIESLNKVGLTGRGILYVLLRKSLNYEEGSFYYGLSILTDKDIAELLKRIKLINSEKNLTSKFVKELDKLIYKFSRGASSDLKWELALILGSKVASLTAGTRKGVHIGASLKEACNYSNAEDSYWSLLSDY